MRKRRLIPGQWSAHERVIRTLREWDIRLDESLFLGGLTKSAFLEAFAADVDRAVEAMRGISQPVGVTGQRDVNVEVVDGRAREILGVLPAGFEYDGAVYRSLSAVAKAVTGSHWNGLLFFGLAQSKKEKA